MTEHAVWLVPLLIFAARICDVSIGTLRMMMVISGHRVLSALLGFAEVLIWVLAVGGAVKHLDNPLAVLAFAGGFAAGTIVGMSVERRLAIGYRVVRVISSKRDIDLAGALRARGYTATRIDGHGRDGPVEIVFLSVRRRVVPALLEAVGAIAPEAFVTVERAERVSGLGPHSTEKVERVPWRRFSQIRK
jgi:uncharacterized protein YebE (UPF0316 family)